MISYEHTPFQNVKEKADTQYLYRTWWRWDGNLATILLLCAPLPIYTNCNRIITRFFGIFFVHFHYLFQTQKKELEANDIAGLDGNWLPERKRKHIL